MGQFIQLTSADGFGVSAYVAHPEGTPKAAVVVLQEIFGAPSYVLDGEIFWGQDRLDFLQRKLGLV